SLLAHAADDCIIGFDSFGRTWHRAEMRTARSVAGHREIGDQVLTRLETWIFRRYLNQADETGIKALKRRILTLAIVHQDDWREVRHGCGGIAAMEETIGLLQLLVGGDQTEVRQRTFFDALAGLQKAGTLTAQETSELSESHNFLHRLEHRM